MSLYTDFTTNYLHKSFYINYTQLPHVSGHISWSSSGS